MEAPTKATTNTPSPPSVTPNASKVSLEPSVCSATIEPAPTVEIQMSSLNGCATVSVLPDLGAEVSIAGYGLLQLLNEHPDNLLLSQISPRAIDGSAMHPLGKLPVKLKLEDCRITEEFHIYATTIISWKITKCLRIQPHHYPCPISIEGPPHCGPS